MSEEREKSAEKRVRECVEIEKRRKKARLEIEGRRG